MEQQNNTQTVKKHNPVLALIMSWLIITGTYLLLRIMFLTLGFHLYPAALGGCLAIIPYLLGAIYLWRSNASQKVGYYALGIMLPAIVEKVMLYLLGSFLYGMNPGNIAGVLEKIAQKEPFTNFITIPSARYIFEISFLGWPYILGSLVVCVLLVFLLVSVSKIREAK